MAQTAREMITEIQDELYGDVPPTAVIASVIGFRWFAPKKEAE